MEYQAMQDVLTSLLSSVSKENLKKSESALSSEQIDRLAQTIKAGNLDEIDCIVFSGFRYAIQDLTQTMGLCAEAAFIVEHYNFVEASFCKMYEKYEGSSCCSDKSRSVVGRLFDYYLKGDEIVFDDEYDYTFHHPKKILNTHQKIVSFLTALRNFYYGSPQQYLNCVLQIDREAGSP